MDIIDINRFNLLIDIDWYRKSIEIEVTENDSWGYRIELLNAKKCKEQSESWEERYKSLKQQ